MSAGRASGFSLLEVLVAVALASVVVLVAVRMLAGGRTVDRALSVTSTSARALDVAAELLAAELRRAGYVPYPDDGGWTPSPGLSLQIHTGTARGDAVGVRYLDDRVVDGPVQRDLIFDVAVDGRGEAQLYRRTASGNRQPLVQGVTELRVLSWADAGGLHRRSELSSGSLRPWLLVFSLRAADASERVVAVALPSRPDATVVVGP